MGAPRARQGLASVNLTTVVRGLPSALGCIYLIGRWLAGDVWSRAAARVNHNADGPIIAPIISAQPPTHAPADTPIVPLPPISTASASTSHAPTTTSAMTPVTASSPGKPRD